MLKMLIKYAQESIFGPASFHKRLKNSLVMHVFSIYLQEKASKLEFELPGLKEWPWKGTSKYESRSNTP